MLDNCARGIFKTASGRLIRFAKGNLKTTFNYTSDSEPDEFTNSFHSSQVEGYSSKNSTMSIMMDGQRSIDIYAFGASGASGALNSNNCVIKPTSLYTGYTDNDWYYTGYKLSDTQYDFGNMTGLPEGFHTMTTDDFSAFDGFYKNNTIYNESSFSKFPSSNQVLVITKESPSKDEIKSIQKTQVPDLEKKYNAIFFINSGYSLRSDGSNYATYKESPTYYWIADGFSNGENYLRVMNGNGAIQEFLASECYNSGAAVRLVHTEFDPNSSNQ